MHMKQWTVVNATVQRVTQGLDFIQVGQEEMEPQWSRRCSQTIWKLSAEVGVS